jgi:hypothetical protein
MVTQVKELRQLLIVYKNTIHNSEIMNFASKPTEGEWIQINGDVSHTQGGHWRLQSTR